MLAQKELDIIQALIEEEIIRSSSIVDSSIAGLMEQYKFTLVNIESKLSSIQNAQNSSCRAY